MAKATAAVVTRLDAWEHLAQTGRFPSIEHDGKPWEFRGWLRLYVQEIHRVHPNVPDRWGYLYQIVSTGRLPKEPIPKLYFHDGPHTDGVRAIKKALDIVSADGHGSWGAMTTFVQWLGWALGTRSAKALPSLSDRAHEALYRLDIVGPWLTSPYDFLGGYIAEHMGGGAHAFYPTPMSIVQMMTMMLFGEDGDHRLQEVCDPCLGTGRFLLAASNYSLLLSGQDIDPDVIAVSEINGMLYAPWINFRPKIEAKKVPPLKIGMPQHKPLPPKRKPLPPKRIGI